MTPEAEPPVEPGHRRIPWPAIVLGVLVIALVALAVVQMTKVNDVTDERDQLAAAEADQRDARLVASQFAEAFFTYDFEDVDASRTAVLSLVTDEYAANFEANRLPGITELFTNTQLTTSGTSQDVFLTEIADSAAQAVVIVDVAASGELESRTLDDLTLILQMRQQDGEWKVDEVRLPQTRILGPDGQPVGTTTTSTTTTTTPP